VLQDFDRVRRSRASRIQNHTREMHERKTAEQMYKHNLYNWTYPGIEVCLDRLRAGKEMIDLGGSPSEQAAASA
jgi:salicylate hydroxylase